MRPRVKRALLGCLLGAVGLLAAGCAPGWVNAHAGTYGLIGVTNGTPGNEWLSVAATCTRTPLRIGNTYTVQSCPGAGQGELLVTNTFLCNMDPLLCSPTLSLFRAHTILGTFFPEGSCVKGPCMGRGGTIIFGVGSLAGQPAYYLYAAMESQTTMDVSPLLGGISSICASFTLCASGDLSAYFPADTQANGVQILLLFTPGTSGVAKLWPAMQRNQDILTQLYDYMLTQSNYSTTHILKVDSLVGFRPDSSYAPLGPAVVGRFYACENNCVHITTLPPFS